MNRRAREVEVQDQHVQRRVLWTLCVTVTVSYGVLQYAFPVMSSDIVHDTGWSRNSIMAAFSGGLLVAAAVGIPVGVLLDRHGPRWIMTSAAVLGVPSVVLIAWSPVYGWFLGGWLLAGVAAAGLLYPPAFAAITRWSGDRRVPALTALTLVAGFASTIFAPVTAMLLDRFSWRGAFVALAVTLAVVTIPGHLWGLRGAWPDAGDRPTRDREADRSTPGATMRSVPFVALIAAMACAALCAYAVVINLVPLLQERGLSTEVAAWALGLGGVGQVLGRLVYPWLARRASVRVRTVAIILAVSVTTALLGVLTSPWIVMAAAVLAGSARGFMTLVNATAVSDRWGVAHYGRFSGVLSAAVTVTVAIAPWLGASLAGATGGYMTAFLILAGIALVGSTIAVVSVPRPQV